MHGINLLTIIIITILMLVEIYTNDNWNQMLKCNVFTLYLSILDF